MELRPYIDRDAGLTVALETDPSVKRYLGGVLSEEEAAEVHRERMAGIARGDRYWVVSAGEPAGVVGIWATPWGDRTVDEVGWMLLPAFHGQGLGRRAAAAAVDEARGPLHAFPAVENPASNAICLSLGFHRLDDVDLDYAGRPLRCAHYVWDGRNVGPGPGGSS